MVHGVSTVDRIDYGNDTATAAVKGPLNVARRSGLQQPVMLTLVTLVVDMFLLIYQQ